MKKLIDHLGRTVLLLTLAAPATLLAGPDDVAVQVNDAAISERVVAQYAESVGGRQPANPAERKRVIDELALQELWAQQALKAGLEKDPDIKARLENSRRSQLATAAIEHYQRENPITDEQLKAAYDKVVKSHPTKEYKARHILLKNEEDAVKVIEELNNGGDFAELAKKHSTGPSAANGGDLGWFTLTTMVKPFSDAVSAVKKGDYSQAPIKTQFGWHVVKLEDYRDKEPPKMEQIKMRLQMMLRQQQMHDRIKQLREEAKVEVKE